MAIMMTVLTGITGAFASASKSQVAVANRHQAQADARSALKRMRDDIHCAFYVQSISQNHDSGGNPTEGFSLALTELANQCATVSTVVGTETCGQGDTSCVFLQWCTVPSVENPGTFDLYRSNTTCGATSGVRVASNLVAPQGGWPSNDTVTATSWNGNLWPSSRSCVDGFLPTQAVNIAVNPSTVDVTTGTYELQDEIALRNAARWTLGSCGLFLDLAVPASGTVNTAIPAASITATLSGAISGGAGAAITYGVIGPQASAPATCTGGTPLTTANVSANGTYNPSSTFTPTSAGTYWWYATWPGNTNNNPANSPCPPAAQTVVALPTPTLSVSAPATGTVNAAIPAASITATLSGATAGGAGAAITYSVIGPQASAPATCTGGTPLTTANVSANGTYNPSSTFTPTSAGTYWWYASWAGNTNNNPANSPCPPAAQTVVSLPTPTLSVSAPATGTVNVAIPAASITATLSGATAGGGGAAITYRVIGPQATAPATCTTGGTTLTAANVSANGAYNPSSTFTPTSAGTYWWYASWAGNTNNNPANSPCPPAAQTVAFAAAAPGLVSLVMLDNDTNGKVDRIVATFDATLAACTAPCTAGWTLVGVPSGGTLASVAVSGTTATLTITEGAGAPDTAVGSLTVALSASSGITGTTGSHSSFAATAPADQAKPVPVTIASANKTGGTARQAEAGDTVTVTFSEPLAALGSSTSTVTLSTSAGNNKPVTLTVTGLTLSAFQIGTTNDYLNKGSADAVFGPAASTLSKPASNQVRVTLGTWTGTGTLTQASATVGTTTPFAAAASITDVAGNPAAGSLAVTITFF